MVVLSRLWESCLSVIMCCSSLPPSVCILSISPGVTCSDPSPAVINRQLAIINTHTLTNSQSHTSLSHSHRHTESAGSASCVCATCFMRWFTLLEHSEVLMRTDGLLLEILSADLLSFGIVCLSICTLLFLVFMTQSASSGLFPDLVRCDVRFVHPTVCQRESRSASVEC